MAVALALALAAAGCSRQESPEQLLAQARQFEAKGDNRAAVIQLKNALQAKPDDAAARLALGKLYLKLGDHASAEKELQRASQLGADRAAVLPLLARSLLLQNKPQAVLDATASASPDAALLSLRGDALLLLKKQDDARAAYEQALQLQPNHSDALHGLARMALMKRDVGEAVRLADAAVTNNPQDVDALMFRGDLDRATGKLDEARQRYDKAIALNPDGGAAYLQKAYVDISQKHYDAARADLASLRKVAPQNLLAWHAQALLEFTEGKYKEALSSIQNVLKAAPDHLPSLLLAGATQFALGSMPQAEQHLKKYLETDTGNLYARKLLASAYLGMGQAASAQATLKDVLADSKDPALLYIAGRAQMDLSQYQQAAATYARAIALAPEQYQPHLGLGLARMSLGDGAAAVAEMREALRLSGPQAVDAGIVLGMTHLQLKQFDAATAVFTDMQKRAPDNALLYNLLGGARLGARDRAGARAAFEKSASLKADFFTPVQNLGRMDVTDNKPDAARQRYQAFVERHPGNVDALVSLAELAAARNQPAEAIGWLEKAVAANPKLPGPGMRLTQLYLQTGDKRKALTQIRTMQVADPGNPSLLDMLGSVQAANGDKAAALEAYQRLAAIQPRTTTMAARLSAAYEALGERDLAADVLRKATADYPEDMSLLLARAAVETRRGNHEQAVLLAREAQKRPTAQVAGLVAEAEIREAQHKPELAIAPYQKALDVDKSATPLRIKLANAHRLAGRPDEAIKLVQQWRAQRPDDNALGVYLGELYLGQKKYPAAIETLNTLLKRVPDNGIVLNNLALAYQGAADPRALGVAEQAYKALPKSPAVMDTLGWLLVEKGELARGVGLLKQASAAEPGAGDIRYHLAAALARSNDRAAARKELEALLSTKGDVAQAEQARALLKQL